MTKNKYHSELPLGPGWVDRFTAECIASNGGKMRVAIDRAPRIATFWRRNRDVSQTSRLRGNAASHTARRIAKLP
jgi:hypothetical protein